MSYMIKAFAVWLLVVLTSFVGFAQEPTQLVVGQANVMMLNPGDTTSFTYALNQPSYITFDVFGDSAAPTLSIWRDGEVLEQLQPPTGQTSLASSLLLEPGTYIWDVGIDRVAANVMLTITSEVAIPTFPLEVNVMLSGEVDALRPAALYTFSLLNEPTYLYIDSHDALQGVFARLTRLSESGPAADEAASITALPLGTRLRLPAGSDAFRLEVFTNGAEGSQAFTLCLVPVVFNYCGGVSDPFGYAGASPSGSGIGGNTGGGMPLVPTLIGNGGIPLATLTPSVLNPGVDVPVPTPTPALIIPQPTSEPPVLGGGGIVVPTPTPALIIPEPTPVPPVLGGGGVLLPTPTTSGINPGGLPLATPGT